MLQLAGRAHQEQSPVLVQGLPDAAFQAALCVPLPAGLLYVDSLRSLDLQAVDRVRAYKRRLAFKPIALVPMLLAAWLVGGFLLHRTPSTPIRQPAASAPLETVGQSFLGCLQRGQYHAAYEMLSIRARSGLSAEQFEEAARAYAEDAEHRYELGTRQVRRESEDELAVGSWRWSAVQEAGQWRLDRMREPVRIPDG